MRFIPIFYLWMAAFAGTMSANDLPMIHPSPEGSLAVSVVPTGRDAGARHIEDDSDSAEKPFAYGCRNLVPDKAGHRQHSDCFKDDGIGRRSDLGPFAGYSIHHWIAVADKHVKILAVPAAAR